MKNREITMINRKLCSRTRFLSVLGVAAAAAALLAIPNSASAADETFVSYGFLPNPGLVSFDISWVDVNDRLYFLADRSNLSVDIVPIGPNPLGLSPFSLNRLIPAAGHGFAGTGAASCGTNCAGPNGVITFVNTINISGKSSGTPELWVGDGPTADGACAAFGMTTCSTVKVFDAAHGNTPTHTIATGGNFRADELCSGTFEVSNTTTMPHNFVAIANDADVPPFVSIIDTDTYKIVTKINFDGNTSVNGPGTGTSGPNATNGIEQCLFANDKFIINIPEVDGLGNDTSPGAVVTIDPRLGVSNSYGYPVIGNHSIDITSCAGPQGIAADNNDNVLLGCNAPSVGGLGTQNSVIVTGTTPSGTAPVSINTVLVNQGGADEVWYNPSDYHFYLALGSQAPTEILAAVDSYSATVDSDVTVGVNTNVPLSGGRRAHSVAGDALTGYLGLPVPATSATFTSTLCGSSATQGCIVMFGPNLFDSADGGSGD